MKNIWLVIMCSVFMFGSVQKVNALGEKEQNRVNLEVELTNNSDQSFEVELNGKNYTITVEDVPTISTFTYTDITLPSSFTKKVCVENNGVLEGKASFTGTSTSTKGTVTNVTGATLSGPLITGVSWQKNLLTSNGGKWGVGQAIFSYSFIVVGGSASLTLQLTAQTNGKGVIALF